MENYGRTYRSGLNRFDERRDPSITRSTWRCLLSRARRTPCKGAASTRGETAAVLHLPADKTALCGVTLKVELPMEDDAGEQDSCPRCVGPARRSERTRGRGRGWDDIPPGRRMLAPSRSSLPLLDDWEF